MTDKRSGEVLAQKDLPNGAGGVVELSPGLIAVECFNSLKIFEICD